MFNFLYFLTFFFLRIFILFNIFLCGFSMGLFLLILFCSPPIPTCVFLIVDFLKFFLFLAYFPLLSLLLCPFLFMYSFVWPLFQFLLRFHSFNLSTTILEFFLSYPLLSFRSYLLSFIHALIPFIYNQFYFFLFFLLFLFHFP